MKEQTMRDALGKLVLSDEAEERILAGVAEKSVRKKSRMPGWKKTVLIAAAATLLTVLTIGTAFADEIFNHFNTASWIDKEGTNLISFEDFLLIEAGASFDDVVEAIGKPCDIYSEGTDSTGKYRNPNAIECKWKTKDQNYLSVVFTADHITSEELLQYYQMEDSGEVIASKFGGDFRYNFYRYYEGYTNVEDALFGGFMQGPTISASGRVLHDWDYTLYRDVLNAIRGDGHNDFNFYFFRKYLNREIYLYCSFIAEHPEYIPVVLEYRTERIKSPVKFGKEEYTEYWDYFLGRGNEKDEQYSVEKKVLSSFEHALNDFFRDVEKNGIKAMENVDNLMFKNEVPYIFDAKTFKYNPREFIFPDIYLEEPTYQQRLDDVDYHVLYDEYCDYCKKQDERLKNLTDEEWKNWLEFSNEEEWYKWYETPDEETE